METMMEEEPQGQQQQQPNKRRGFLSWFCCGAPRAPRERKAEKPPKKPKRERRPKRHPSSRRHRHRHAHGAASPALVKTGSRSELAHASLMSAGTEDDWHDAQDNFSSSDGHSAPGSPRGGGGSHAADGSLRVTEGSCSGSSASSSYEASSADGDAGGAGGVGVGARFVSCLAVMARHDGTSTAGVEAPDVPLVAGHRLPAGCTLPRRRPGDDPATAAWCWDECDATTYSVRGVDYARTKVKVPSGKALYRLVAVDVYRTEQKAYHAARLAHLPPPRRDAAAVGDAALPPLLVFNVQLPQYPAGFFGPSDGPGQSVVYYFALPEDFDPSRCENRAALDLFARFVANGREADGAPTRERLKLIARIVNADEWARVAPLSAAEHKLLTTYNEKPVLTRPQHNFYVGHNYLEVDVDVHAYAFLARRALNSYHSRLKSVVWEIAFVVQGNDVDELPEQVIGCGRIYRTDFETVKPWAAHAPAAAAVAAAAAAAEQQQQQQHEVQAVAAEQQQQQVPRSDAGVVGGSSSSSGGGAAPAAAGSSGRTASALSEVGAGAAAAAAAMAGTAAASSRASTGGGAGGVGVRSSAGGSAAAVATGTSSGGGGGGTGNTVGGAAATTSGGDASSSSAVGGGGSIGGALEVAPAAAEDAAALASANGGRRGSSSKGGRAATAGGGRRTSAGGA